MQLQGVLLPDFWKFTILEEIHVPPDTRLRVIDRVGKGAAYCRRIRETSPLSELDVEMQSPCLV